MPFSKPSMKSRLWVLSSAVTNAWRPTPRPSGGHVGMEATDEAVALEAAHALVHRRSREAEPLGQVGVGLAPVLLKSDEYLAVESVHEASTVLRSGASVAAEPPSSQSTSRISFGVLRFNREEAREAPRRPKNLRRGRRTPDWSRRGARLLGRRVLDEALVGD